MPFLVYSLCKWNSLHLWMLHFQGRWNDPHLSVKLVFTVCCRDFKIRDGVIFLHLVVFSTRENVIILWDNVVLFCSRHSIRVYDQWHIWGELWAMAPLWFTFFKLYFFVALLHGWLAPALPLWDPRHITVRDQLKHPVEKSDISISQWKGLACTSIEGRGVGVAEGGRLAWKIGGI